jgi:hypothetical protein
MRSITTLALSALMLGLAARAQQLQVRRIDGQVDGFLLSQIDSITFAYPDTATQRTGNDVLRVHTPDRTRRFAVDTIDSLTYASDTWMRILQASGATPFALADVDSLTFTGGAAGTVRVEYTGSSVVIDNPLQDLGVAIAVDGAQVTVNADQAPEGVLYLLTGTTGEGGFKIYSDTEFTLGLDGVQLTSTTGPAINIQAEVEVAVELFAGTVSQLTDATSYQDAPDGEDQKAAFFSEGNLVFTGTGALEIMGQGDAQHGLASDGLITVLGGDLVIQQATRDAIHTNDGYLQEGGHVVVTASGSDGVDAGDGPVDISGGTLTVVNTADDSEGLKCDGELVISGGTVDLMIGGDASKGLNAVSVALTGGNVSIQTTGGVILEASGLGVDPSYCTAIKADGSVLLDGCEVEISTTGPAGRGISCDGVVQALSGSLQVTSSGGGAAYTNPEGEADAWHGPCLNADGNLDLLGGNITLGHSGSGGKGISGDANLVIGSAEAGPTLAISTTGTRITIGGGEYAEAKGISVDSLITIANGDLTVSTPDDAFKSKTRIVMNGGTVTIPASAEGMEAPFIDITGGVIHLTSTDDGLNATMGNDIEGNDGSLLHISGGYIHLNAANGDGIDSNGNLTIDGGTIVLHGPPAQPEVGLDVNGTFRVDGGTLVVSQINSNMVEPPAGVTTQRCVLFRRSQGLAANTIFRVQDEQGNPLVTFAPARTYSCILLSDAAIAAGTTYQVYTGGSCTGTVQDGVYTGGTYSGGTLRASFTSTSMVQTVNF